MTVLWAATELPAHDPEPDDQDDDGPWCRFPHHSVAPDGLGGAQGPSRPPGRFQAV